MRTKIIIIFLCSLCLSYLIYDTNDHNKISVFSIGDDLSLGKTPFGDYNKSYDYYLKNELLKTNKLKHYYNNYSMKNLNFEDFLDYIKSNKSIMIKSKTSSINQQISKSNIIIMSLNNEQNFKKCNKSFKTYTSFLDKNEKVLQMVTDQLSKISKSKIIIIGFYCNTYNKEINEYIEKLHKNKDYIYINLYEKFKEKYSYIPSNRHYYPSLDGYYYIYKEILNNINNDN